MKDTVRCSTCGKTLPLGSLAAGEAAGLYYWKRHLDPQDCLRHLTAKVLAAVDWLEGIGLSANEPLPSYHAARALRILTDRELPDRIERTGGQP